jgi:hypothetical protein
LGRLLSGTLLVLLIGGLLLAQPPKKDAPEQEDPKSKPVKKLPGEDDDTKKKPLKKVPTEDDDPPPKPPAKKPADEPKKAPPKKVVEEEEGKSKPPKKVVEEEEAKGGRAFKPLTGNDTIDLSAELQATRHPELVPFFNAIVHPHDRLQHREDGWLNAMPVPIFIGDRPNREPFSYKLMERDGKPNRIGYGAARDQVLQAQHYEQIILDRCRDLLSKKLERKTSDPSFLSRIEQYVVVEKAILAGLKFHDSARERGIRKGTGWDKVKSDLNAMLLEALLEQLGARTDAAKTKAELNQAADLAARIAETFPNDKRAQISVVLWRMNRTVEALAGDRDEVYIQARDKFVAMERQYSRIGETADSLKPLREQLEQRAKLLLDRAKQVAANEDGRAMALRLLENASRIWPDTPGLQDYQLELSRAFRLLTVGVRSLPERMSPFAARTDSDRWATELIFESLVQSVPDARVGLGYRAVLADRLPRLIPLGREFRLAKGTSWTGKGAAGEVTTTDVRDTLIFLKENKGLRAAEGIELLDRPQLEDPTRLPLRLEHGYIDPLSLMTFKVIPMGWLREKKLLPTDEGFAQQPIGSGPFIAMGRKIEDNKEYAVFRSNPAYSRRTGRIGMPRIQEIRFVVSPADPTADLQAGKLDLILDPPTETVTALRNPDKNLSREITDVALPSRRIWILAMNHRKVELGGDEGKPLRRALGHAIDRKKALDAVFRAGTSYHRELSGPFPPETWACPTNPEPTPLFSVDRAQTFAKQAKGAPFRLTLKHSTDPRSVKACAEIKQQVDALALSIELVLTPMPEAELFKAVWIDHDYELAYIPLDYSSYMFWLGGIFDPEARGRGDRNFLGYDPDPTYLKMLQDVRSRRDFSEVRKYTHLLHHSFAERMPFVPLWQLDTHAIVSQKLVTVPVAAQLDPLTVFDQSELWRLER